MKKRLESDAGSNPPACSTVGDAYAEAADPKRMRVKTLLPFHCKACNRINYGHRPDCPEDTIEAANKRADLAKDREKWARERAEYWLNEVRKMHGKLAMLKAELRKLRSRSNREPSPPPTK